MGLNPAGLWLGLWISPGRSHTEGSAVQTATELRTEATGVWAR